MARTTIKTLESLIALINKVTKSPAEPYTKVEGGIKANIGNYHLYQAYGCVGLHRMMNEGGGVNDIFNGCTRSELEGKLRAFLAGYALATVVD